MEAESKQTMEIEMKDQSVKVPQVLIVMGMAGSGKTTFVNALI